jgi:transcriptional regulator with XRE-family HTH domain
MRSINWLRKQRELVGIDTQEDLATKLQLEGINVTRASVSHWENERNNPPLDDPDFRKALARVLKVSQPELLKLAGYEVARLPHSEAAERGAFIIDQLPADEQDLAVKILEQFLDRRAARA